MASSSTPIESRERKTRARKCLFGKPDKKEVDEWLDELQSRAAEKVNEASRAWGFDFTREKPMDEPGPANTPIDYEAIPAEKVPSFYRSRSYRNGEVVLRREVRKEMTPEEQRLPTITSGPTKKRGMGRRVKEEEEEEMKEEVPSTSNQRTLKGEKKKEMKEKEKEKETKKINLRQARITNYLAPRKRPSMEKEPKGTEKIRRLGEIGSSSSSPSASAPPSPFRFADDHSLSTLPSNRRITRAIAAKNV